MSYISDEAKNLAARLVAAKTRMYALYERRRIVSEAYEEAVNDASAIESELRSEVGNVSHQYLVGDRIVLVKRGSGSVPSIDVVVPTIVEPQAVLVSSNLPENDDDIPARAVKLVASK